MRPCRRASIVVLGLQDPYLSQAIGGVVALLQRSSPTSSPSCVANIAVLVHRLGQSHLNTRAVHHLEGPDQESDPPQGSDPSV